MNVGKLRNISRTAAFLKAIASGVGSLVLESHRSKTPKTFDLDSFSSFAISPVMSRSIPLL